MGVSINRENWNHKGFSVDILPSSESSDKLNVNRGNINLGLKIKNTNRDIMFHCNTRKV